MPSTAASFAPATVPEYSTSSAAFRPRLTPEITRSGGVRQQVARAHDHAVGRRAFDREVALAELAQPQRIVERQRMRHAGLVVFGRDHPDVVGELAGDLLADLQPMGVDAVIVGDQDAHALPLPPPLAGEVDARSASGGAL